MAGLAQTRVRYLNGALSRDTGGVPVRWLDERRRRVALLGIGLYAGLASLSRPFSDAAAVAVAAAGAGVLVLAVLHRPVAGPPTTQPPVRRAALAWATVLALVAVWDLVAWVQQPAYNVASHDHPTISILLDPVTEPLVPRFAAWCCWLYVGVRLVRR